MAYAGFSEEDWIAQAIRFWDAGPSNIYETLISVGLTPSEANQVVNKADDRIRGFIPNETQQAPRDDVTQTEAPAPAQPSFAERFSEMESILGSVPGLGGSDYEWWAANKTPDEARQFVAQRYNQIESILSELPNITAADVDWWSKNKTPEEAVEFVSLNKPAPAPAAPVKPAGPTEAEIRNQVIKEAVESVYNNPNLTPYEKAQQINAAATATNVSRQEIANALSLDLNTVNAYLDQPAPTPTAPVAPPVEAPPQAPVFEEPGMTTGVKPREGFDTVSGNLAEETAIRLIPGLGAGLFGDTGRHTSTYVKTYKVVNGQVVEQPFTQADLNSNDFIFSIGSKTGGAERERVAQNYRFVDGQLTPVGEPKFYQGEPYVGFFEGFAREAVPFVLSVVPGLNVAIGASLGATTTAAAQALGSAFISAASAVAAGANPADALKAAATSFGVSQLVPNLTGNPYIDNALKSGATAVLTGKDVGNAVVNSLIATGAQAKLGNLSITGDRAIDSGLISAATSAAQAAATGGDTLMSSLQGFISGASASLDKPTTPPIAGTSTTIPGTTTTGATTGGANTVTGSYDATDEFGLYEPGDEDVLNLVKQEQSGQTAASNVAAASQVKQINQAQAQQQGLYPSYEQYKGQNGTVYLRDLTTGKITHVLPTGQVTQITGGGVYFESPQMIGAVEGIPANAAYQGLMYVSDPALIGQRITPENISAFSLSTERDPNVPVVGNLSITRNPDGSVTQLDKVTGDTATFDAQGRIIDQTKSAYTKANEAMQTFAGLTTQATGDLVASLSGASRLIGIDPSEIVREEREGCLVSMTQHITVLEDRRHQGHNTSTSQNSPGTVYQVSSL